MNDRKALSPSITMHAYQVIGDTEVDDRHRIRARRVLATTVAHLVVESRRLRVPHLARGSKHQVWCSGTSGVTTRVALAGTYLGRRVVVPEQLRGKVRHDLGSAARHRRVSEHTLQHAAAHSSFRTSSWCVTWMACGMFWLNQVLKAASPTRGKPNV